MGQALEAHGGYKMKKLLSLFSLGVLINLNSYANSSNINSNSSINYNSVDYGKLIEYFSNSRYAVLNSEQDLLGVNCPTNEICTSVIYRSETNSIEFYNFYGYTNSENNLSYITINLVNINNEIINSDTEEYRFNNRQKRGLLLNKIERDARGGGGRGMPGGNWEGAKELAKYAGVSMISAWVGRQYDEFNQNVGGMIDGVFKKDGKNLGKTSVEGLNRNIGGGGNISDKRGGGGTGRGGSNSNMAR
jgi:hypothetical protein